LFISYIAQDGSSYHRPSAEKNSNLYFDDDLTDPVFTTLIQKNNYLYNL